MANEIYITAYEDSLSLNGSIINAVSDSKEYLFDLEDVLKIVIFTTDAGPFDEDMWLKLYAGDDVIFIPSGHRCYEAFLFDQIGNVLPIDYKNIIEASACTVYKEFVLYEREDQEGSEDHTEEGKCKNGIKIIKDKEGGIKVSGSIDLGYIGTFRDSQIELDDTLEDIREWDIVTEHLDEECSDDELIAFLNRYFNDFVEKIERNIDNINGTFLLHVLTDMDVNEINFMEVDDLFIEENLLYGNEEDIAEIYNPVRQGLNTLSAYLETPNDGSIPKGHIESVLRSFYPMFNFDCFIANIIPEVIGLGDGEISFQCSDNFDCLILCGAYDVLDEYLSFSDWHNY